jgi:outer membrane protein TolC
MDLPIDRFPERNNYRKSLIAQQAVIRAADEFADQIRVDVREDLGTVRVALETYRIQQNAVTLAQRRVESTGLNLEAGRANTRDILESQQALLQAQNAATRALIDYHLARLTLFLDLELLRVDPSGIQLDEASLAAPPGFPGDPAPADPGAPPVPPPHSEPRS